jgi:hypothetical protein
MSRFLTVSSPASRETPQNQCLLSASALTTQTGVLPLVSRNLINGLALSGTIVQSSHQNRAASHETPQNNCSLSASALTTQRGVLPLVRRKL